MAAYLRSLQVMEISSVDKAANEHACVVFMKRDNNQEATMDDLVRKLATLSDFDLPRNVEIAISKSLISKADLNELLERRAMEKRLPTESFEQSFAHNF